MSENAPLQLTNALFVQDAIRYARDSYTEGLMRIKAEVAMHPDSAHWQGTIMDALLNKGFIRSAIAMTERSCVFEWIDQRSNVLASNDALLDAWGWDTHADSWLSTHYLGLVFETLDSRKIDLLQDTLDQVGKTLHPTRVYTAP